MNEKINIIKKNVASKGYAASPGFLGYSESISKDYIADCRCTIDILDANFDLVSKESFIVSSLYFDKKMLYKYTDVSKKDYEKYYKDLVTQNIAVEVDISSSIFDFESLEYELMIKKLKGSFRCIEIPALDFIKKILFATMTLDGLKGHFFLLLKEESLIIYPHDDFGVGFIAYGDSMSELMPKLKTRLKAMFENEPNIVMHVWDEEKGTYY